MLASIAFKVLLSVEAVVIVELNAALFNVSGFTVVLSSVSSDGRSLSEVILKVAFFLSLEVISLSP